MTVFDSIIHMDEGVIEIFQGHYYEKVVKASLYDGEWYIEKDGTWEQVAEGEEWNNFMKILDYEVERMGATVDASKENAILNFLCKKGEDKNGK